MYQPTSEVLPVAQFPQFRARARREYDFTGEPFERRRGQPTTPAAVHADDSYMRSDQDVRPADHLGGRRADADGPAVDQHRGRLRQRDRRGADGRRVELDDAAGRRAAARRTRSRPSARPGFLLDAAPVPAHYLTPGAAACTNTGTSGPWNAFTGSSRRLAGGRRSTCRRTPASRSRSRSRTSPTRRRAASARSWMTRRWSSAARGPSWTGSRARRRPGPSGGEPAGSPPNAGNWVIGPKAINFYAGTSTAGHAAARLRARADHQPRRPRDD